MESSEDNQGWFSWNQMAKIKLKDFGRAGEQLVEFELVKKEEWMGRKKEFEDTYAKKETDTCRHGQTEWPISPMYAHAWHSHSSPINPSENKMTRSVCKVTIICDLEPNAKFQNTS